MAREPSRRFFGASQKRLELLRELRRKRGLEGDRSLRIPRRRKSSQAPLSFAQERLWFLDQMEPDNPAYNMPGTVRLRGPLRAAALAASLSEIERRHDALRATFPAAGGEPVQRFRPPSHRPLPAVDLSGLPPEGREAEARRLVARESSRPFSLARGPLMRALLLHLGREHHALHLDLHHIASDGWSMGVLLGELAALYRACCQGAPSPLPPLPVRYADYAHWQRERLTGEVLEALLGYWRQQLAGAPPFLELPTDRRRGAVQTFRGESLRRRLPGGLARSLRALAAGADASLFMVLLAAWSILLQRWSDQDDVVVGSPVAGRTAGELEGLIGLFLNHLVLRVDLAGDPTFSDLLARVRETAVAAYDHQELPFERLLSALEPVRELSRTPLFQVYFNMLSLPPAELDLPGLTVEELGFAEARSKFDLTLYVAEAPEEIRLDLVFNADLFDRERMEEGMDQYELLLEQAVARPGARIGTYTLRTPSAWELLPDPRVELDATWNGSVQSAVAVHAREAGDRVAVLQDGAAISYRRLAELSGSLAGRLAAAGVGRGDRVAIYAHRSAALVPAVLGVLEAGAAFVLLDPAHPAERHLQCLGLARPRAWLALSAAGPPPLDLEGFLAASPELVCRLELPAADGVPGAAGLENADPIPLGTGATEPDDLACITFTSGSTGVPKGVAGLHRSLTHFLPWQSQSFGLGPEDRFCLLSGLAHDPLQRDLFTPLWLGASVAIPDPERLAEPGWLAGWMAEVGVTVIHLTPAMGRLLAEVPGGGEGRLPGLRRAFFVGDALTRRDVERLRRLAPAVEVVNLYGTTETQRAVGFFPITGPGAAAADGAREVLPLGRGMPGAQLLLLGPGDRLAGVGELGEIAVRSPHLAGGYLGDPRLTEERFGPNPFVEAGRRSPGDRLYRTGDLGRYRPDGVVEAAGRRDRQIKIRGFRVEPGEVEAALGRHPKVSEVVVTARGEGLERHLVAHVVAEGPVPEPAELREHLAERLPEAMVPAVFAFLDALPLTPNRKVDLGALPEPEAWDPPHGSQGGEPRGEVEARLAEIWREVLGVERVGREESFFALGGHSLKVTRVLARVREAFGLDLPVRGFFEGPTLAALAQRLEAAGPAPAAETSPALEPAPRDGELPLSFAQQRLWFLDRFAPGHSAYTLSTSVRLAGRLHGAALEAALSEVVRRHEVLRTRMVPVDGRPVQEISSPWPMGLGRVDLSRLGAAERRRREEVWARRHTRAPFDLERGPLVRFYLLRRSAEEHLFLVIFHHLVADAWSLGIFARELAALYQAFLEGGPSPLPELRLHYADFAYRQQRLLRGASLEALLAYWRRQLSGVPPALELPTDRPRPPAQDFRGGLCSLELSEPLTEALESLGQSRGATLFMTLTAAFQLLLHRLSGQEVVVIGTPVAGRGERELEGLIGLFLDVVALATDLGGDPPFLELLDRVREVTLGAFAHQGLPFERLLAELQPPRDPARHPIFDVMINFINVPRAEVRLPGLTLSLPEPLEREAKLAITLYALEHRGRLRLSLVYQRSLFSRRRMAIVMDQLGALLEQIVEHPEAPISRFSLRTPAGRRSLPDPTLPLARPRQEPVEETVAARAHAAPESTAITCGPRVWTYGALEQAVARLAARLASLGLGRGEVAAVSGRRSFALVAALLAVWRCGGVILPLDPGLPAERRRRMVVKARARWLLDAGGGTPVAAELDDGPGWTPLELDPDTAELIGAVAGTGGGVGSALPDDAAYVFFTSGSRGEPKGVLGSHQGLAHFLAWQRATFRVGPSDRSAQLTALSFDVVLRDLFLPLTSGAVLCLPGEAGELAAERVLPWLEAEGVTLLHTVPALMQMWLEDPPPRVPLAALRQLFFAGEPLPAALVDRFRSRFPRSGQVVNLYGPTETTLAKCCYPVPLHRPPGVQPVGRPLPQTQALVLAGEGRLCGVGEVGEIALRTPFMSLGYLDLGDEEPRRFRPNPFRNDPADLIYLSGDLGRYRPDGCLEILGRLDDQVKIRGVRVEPEEVTAVLAGHPALRGAVVVAGKGAGGAPELVAYGVPEVPGAVSRRELSGYLSRRLPPPLMPTRFVFLERLPLGPNGKVDRAALPPPGPASTAPAAASRPPRGRLERVLAEIWREVLEVESVAAGDHFFDLGGHSLLAVRLMSRIEARLGRRLPVAVLFERPTLEELARELGHEGDPLSGGPLVRIQGGGSRPPLFLVHPGGGGVLCYAELSRALGPEQPLYGLQAVGLDGEAEPLDRIEGMALRYLEAIRGVVPEGPYHLGGWSLGGRIAFEMARRLGERGEPVGSLTLLDIDAHADEELYRDEAAVLVRALGRSIPLSVEELRDLSGDEAFDRIVQRAREAGVLPADFDRAQARRLYRVFTANMRAARGYRPGPWPGRLTLLRAAEGDRLNRTDPTAGWGELVQGGVEVVTVPGDHWTMVEAPHVAAVARALRRVLDRAVAERPRAQPQISK